MAYWIVPIGALLLAAIWWQIGFLILNLSKRIAEIEKQVNGLMKEDLLVWETRLWERGGALQRCHNQRNP